MEETPNLYNQNSFACKNDQILENMIDYQEYFLLNDNIINKIIIGQNKKEIFIKCKNYMISFNQIEFSTLIKAQVNSLDETFKYIMNVF